MNRYIVAIMRPDWVEPYRKEGSDIPVVVTSTHPRFIEGTRFDYGFLRIALDEGYFVTILPSEKP